MKEIDRLQDTVHNLQSQRTAGRPARDEKKQIQEALDGLQARHTLYREQRQGTTVSGPPVAREHLDFLESYAHNALQDARSVVSSMEQNPSGKKTPLDTLPAHADLLKSKEKERFEKALAIVNSLMKDRPGPLPSDEVARLRKAAFRLEKYNKRCERRLTAIFPHPEANNPAHVQRRYDSIDRFQSALDRAVEEAIGNEAPTSRTKVSTGLTGDESFDRSMDEIHRLLHEGQKRPLAMHEWYDIGEHIENMDARLETLGPDQQAVANEAKESIRAKIDNYRMSLGMERAPRNFGKASVPPLMSPASLQKSPRKRFKDEGNDEEDHYSLRSPLPPAGGGRTEKFGRRSTMANDTHSFTDKSTQEGKIRRPFTPAGAKRYPPLSLFASDSRDVRQMGIMRPSWDNKPHEAPLPPLPRTGLLVRTSTGPDDAHSSTGKSAPYAQSPTSRRASRGFGKAIDRPASGIKDASLPSTPRQQAGSSSTSVFAQLRMEESELPPQGWTSESIKDWRFSVNGSESGDVPEPSSLSLASVARDLTNPAEEQEPVTTPVMPLTMHENPSVTSLFETKVKTAQPEDDDIVSDIGSSDSKGKVDLVSNDGSQKSFRTAQGPQ